jgi:hypothetical protein
MWLLVASVIAATPQVVRLEVAGNSASPWTLRAQGTWLGEERTMLLQPHLGGWSGSWEGEALRMLPLHLELREGELLRAEYDGIELLAAQADVISFAVEADGSLRRTATAARFPRREWQDAAGTAAALGWALLIFVYVTWLVRQRA